MQFDRYYFSVGSTHEDSSKEEFHIGLIYPKKIQKHMGGCMGVSQVTILGTRCPINILNAKVCKFVICV